MGRLKHPEVWVAGVGPGLRRYDVTTGARTGEVAIYSCVRRWITDSSRCGRCRATFDAFLELGVNEFVIQDFTAVALGGRRHVGDT
jgi:hypothetical protein